MCFDFCWLQYWKKYEQISMKFCRGLGLTKHRTGPHWTRKPLKTITPDPK